MKATIKKLLKESTGTHFLDSGGDSNRHWQKNAKRNFDKEPRVLWDKYGYSVNIYHYLCEILDTDRNTQKVNSFITRNELHWVQEVQEEITNRDFMYHEIGSWGELHNTYNGEENISQTLLYQTFRIDEEMYVLLQVHQGADIRGGYTETRCFKLNGYLSGLVDVYGTIDGREVEIGSWGELVYTDIDEEVDWEEVEEVDLDFYVMEGVY